MAEQCILEKKAFEMKTYLFENPLAKMAKLGVTNNFKVAEVFILGGWYLRKTTSPSISKYS